MGHLSAIAYSIQKSHDSVSHFRLIKPGIGMPRALNRTKLHRYIIHFQYAAECLTVIN